MLILGFSALGLILIGAVSECGTKTETEREIHEGVVPLVHEHYTPRWAEGGTSIVFGFGYRGALYVVDSTGSNLRRISKASKNNEEFDLDYSPDVSPDGTRIAYTTLRQSTGSAFSRVHSFEIVTSALDGSDVRRLTENESLETNPVWSPDGTRIAFLSDRGNSVGRFRLYTMAADGSDVRSVAPSLRASGDPPVWSPNGELLAFYALEEPDSEDGGYKSVLYTIRSDGSELARLSEMVATRQAPDLPAWSPDGSRIAFTHRQEDGRSIYIVDYDGDNPRKLIDARTGAPYWSPDGSEILYFSNGLLSAVPIDGSEVRVLAETDRGGTLAWSPDGSRIAVRVDTTRLNRDSKVVLYTFSLDGSDMRVLVRERLHGGLVAEHSGWREERDDAAVCSEGLVVPKPEKNPGLVQDCEVLLSIRDTLAGEDVVLDWNADIPISEWGGVYVRGDEARVRGLRLEGLNGTIPPELGNLAKLERLYLAGSRLTGSIPPELGNLTNLTELRLRHNQLTGGIPPELGNLTNLTELRLEHNLLTGNIPTELGNLTNLVSLGLEHNRLTGKIPSELGRLVKLQSLAIGWNNLTGCIPKELVSVVDAGIARQEGLEPC